MAWLLGMGVVKPQWSAAALVNESDFSWKKGVEKLMPGARKARIKQLKPLVFLALRVRPGGTEYSLLSLSVNGGVIEAGRLLNEDFGCVIPAHLVGKKMSIRIAVASSQRKKITVFSHIWSSAGQDDPSTTVDERWKELCPSVNGTEKLVQEGEFDAFTGRLS